MLNVIETIPNLNRYCLLLKKNACLVSFTKSSIKSVYRLIVYIPKIIAVPAMAISNRICRFRNICAVTIKNIPQSERKTNGIKGLMLRGIWIELRMKILLFETLVKKFIVNRPSAIIF